MNLKHLTDKVLLADTKVLAGKEREITVKILHHLREIECRRLFSDLGYSSLFEYAVKELGYSEPAAHRRIQNARVIKDFPNIEKKLSDGSLTMTNVAQAAQIFKNENITDPVIKKQILKEIENTSKRGCAQKLMEFSTPTPLPKENVKVVSPTFFNVHWNLSQETMKLFEELRNLLAHRRLQQDQILAYAFERAQEQALKDKFKTNAKFTTPAAKPCTKRAIPNSVKNEVFRRDNGRCTRCRGTYKLEYDHIVPYAMGGESTADNLRILCFSCNQRRLKT
jgi:hypothetical protein